MLYCEVTNQLTFLTIELITCHVVMLLSPPQRRHFESKWPDSISRDSSGAKGPLPFANAVSNLRPDNAWGDYISIHASV